MWVQGQPQHSNPLVKDPLMGPIFGRRGCHLRLRKFVTCSSASLTSYICQRSMALANQEWHANTGTHTRGGVGWDVNVPWHLQSRLVAMGEIGATSPQPDCPRTTGYHSVI